jgi:hypothetical protein
MWVKSSFQISKAPEGVFIPAELARFFSTVLSIADRVELFFILDLLWFVWLKWFFDLTCDFWAENGKRKITAGTTAIE